MVEIVSPPAKPIPNAATPAFCEMLLAPDVACNQITLPQYVITTLNAP